MSIVLDASVERNKRSILESPQKIPVFVYGTLKGMTRGALMGPGSTIDKFLMYDGNFPVVWDGRMPGTLTQRPFAPGVNFGRVKGEFYFVSVSELNALDEYEGYPNLYTRDMFEVKVDLGGGESMLQKAWIYIAPRDGSGIFESCFHRRPVEPDELGYLQWPPIPF